MAGTYQKKKQVSRTGRFLKPTALLMLVFMIGYWSGTQHHVDDLIFKFKSTLSGHLDQKVPVKSLTVRENLPKPKFEFYTLLAREQNASPQVVKPPKKDVVNTSAGFVKDSAQSSKPVAQDTVASPAIHDSYLLQVASFKNKSDAERMKAALILKGFEVNIVMVTRERINWHRVMIGPFVSRTQAEKAQLEIARSEHILGMIRRIGAS